MDSHGTSTNLPARRRSARRDRRRRAIGLGSVAAVTLAAFGLAAVPANGAVLLELFTSQGCSSCPPADRLLIAMGKDPDLAKQVVPLAFHVDYWNRLGWRDRFSDAAWTRRQGDYASAGLAAHRRDSQIRLAFFGVGSTAVLAKHAAAEAKKSIAAAQQALAQDLDPPADLYHSGATKLHLARVLLGRALTQWNMK